MNRYSPHSFSGRTNLTSIIENNLQDLFKTEEVDLIKFGEEVLTHNYPNIKDYFSTMKANKSLSAMMFKFAPDYILFKKTEPQELYFLEIKTSVSPLAYDSRINSLKRKHGNDINSSNVGVIAREAFYAYRRLFPNTIILMGCNYNNKVLMAEFAENLKPLHIFKNGDPNGYELSLIDSKTHPFEIEINTSSSGSQKPQLNVNLDNFKPSQDFFDMIGISTNGLIVEKIKSEIKRVGIVFPNNPNVNKKRAVDDIKNSGCTWIS